MKAAHALLLNITSLSLPPPRTLLSTANNEIMFPKMWRERRPFSQRWAVLTKKGTGVPLAILGLLNASRNELIGV